jgi:hypothetical protein
MGSLLLLLRSRDLRRNALPLAEQRRLGAALRPYGRPTLHTASSDSRRRFTAEEANALIRAATDAALAGCNDEDAFGVARYMPEQTLVYAGAQELDLPDQRSMYQEVRVRPTTGFNERTWAMVLRQLERTGDVPLRVQIELSPTTTAERQRVLLERWRAHAIVVQLGFSRGECLAILSPELVCAVLRLVVGGGSSSSSSSAAAAAAAT